MNARAAAPPPGCPAHAGHRPAPLLSLADPRFADNPEPFYAHLRQCGPVVPVEFEPGVTVMLVLDYRAALEVLRSPRRFSKDARRWDLTAVPPTSAVLPMMAWRPSLLFADGPAHDRLRAPIEDALERVTSHTLRRYVHSCAQRLIDRFAADGHADLVAQYAAVLPLQVITELLGVPEDLGWHMVAAAAAMIDAGPHSERGSADLAALLGHLVAHKRTHPGADVTSWLLAHPAALSDEEMIHQLVVMVGAGTVPTTAWITTALMLLLTDERFADRVAGGSTPTSMALTEVLWSQAPMSNFSLHYPVGPQRLHGVDLPEGMPIAISHHAANTDPKLGQQRRDGNHAHLAFSAGPHRCPAAGPAELITTVAIEALLDRLPDLALSGSAADIRWRPGPFHRCAVALPTTFRPTTTTVRTTEPAQESSWNPAAPTPEHTSWTPAAPTSMPKPPASAHRGRPSWWNFPARFRPGR
ncbi:cytochrome P450 [Kitasatospora sp. NE20-6]|uniref:cytochrome P450 n=1 Tax=Kitasatospora sp. NE20-6 TaxID=2859066 RepID=UPI0034DBFC08